MRNIWDLVRQPLITEKAMVSSDSGKHIFIIAKDANKEAVKKAIETIFQVKVNKINIINVQGKRKRFKNILGKRADFKKAIVTLANGCTIDTGGIKWA